MTGREIFSFKAWVGGAPAVLRVFPDRYEWEPRPGRAHRTAPDGLPPAHGSLDTRAVAGADRRRSGVTTARVELALRPGVDTGLGPGPLVVDAPHDEAGAFYQLALELAGLPVPARRRILGERMTAAARRIDIVGHSMPAAPPPAGGAIAQNGDHDLVGCLARLLAANLLTVDEFESKRRLLGARADGEQSGP